MSQFRFNNPIMQANLPKEETKPEEVKKEIVLPKNNRSALKRLTNKNFWFAALFVLVVALVVVAGNFYFRTKKLQMEVKVGELSEVQKVVAEVSKVILLPTNEDPTVATVSDVEKLRSQPFFANAQNGDKVLIYAKSGKAILYDPVRKIIVEVAPLNKAAKP